MTTTQGWVWEDDEPAKPGDPLPTVEQIIEYRKRLAEEDPEWAEFLADEWLPPEEEIAAEIAAREHNAKIDAEMRDILPKAIEAHKRGDIKLVGHLVMSSFGETPSDLRKLLQHEPLPYPELKKPPQGS